MRSTLAPLVLFANLTLPACGSESADEPAGGPTKIEALGVAADLPAGWSYQEKRGEHWLTKTAFYGARLEKAELPDSLDAAIAGWLVGEVVDKGEASGGFFAVIEAEFPGAAGPQRLPYVYVVVPIGDAAIQCSGQLQAGDDPKPLLDVCWTLKAS